MNLAEFKELARHYDLVPVSREVLFDSDTAVTAYAKIRDGAYSFLLESVIGGEKWARYTFLGSAPREVLRIENGALRQWTAADGWTNVVANDPLDYLDERLLSVSVAPVAGLPRFFGGAVGYLSYDVVRHIERLPNAPADDRAIPEALLIFTDTIIAIDNVFGKAIVIAVAKGMGTGTGMGMGMEDGDGDGDDEMEGEYNRAVQRIETVISALQTSIELPILPLPSPSPIPIPIPIPIPLPGPIPIPIKSNFHQHAFESAVERIQDYIRAGDAFQVVLSQRLSVPFDRDPLDAYRMLRALNPSPYLYLLELDDVALVGSSPEVLVRVEERRIVLKPIAGTRRRGATELEDLALAAELLADEKERAEHLMLVDLGRNDVGRVARFGSVEVKDLMAIERYSHVLHIVTQVEGDLRDDLSAVDVFRACFPAGTVSGAPKVRAMEIIDELEPTRRGPYAGAVGYFAYGGQNMDTAIAIRTLVVHGGMAYVQAGAGVVIDSDPRREWEETLAKAAPLLQICERA